MTKSTVSGSLPGTLTNTFVFIVLCAAVKPAHAQQVGLWIGSGSGSPGSSVALDVSLTVSGGAQPTGIQWSMNYPADVTNISVTASSAAIAAGKSLSCSAAGGSTTCVVFGVNTTAIGNGAVATATITMSPASTSISLPIAVSGIVASDALGNAIPASGTGGVITVIQSTAALSALSCSPTTVNAPGSSACTVTLSKAAPSGGLAVALSSNNPNATVPALVTVGAGATTSSFAATVSSVTIDQPARITATVGGQSQSYTLSLVAPRWSISGTISPASFGNGAILTLSGAGSATATADTSGNYTFAGLVNGSYHVTPSNASTVFTPANASVTVAGANMSGVNFTAAQTQSFAVPTVDVQTWTDQSRTGSRVTSPGFSTASGNELLLAFIAADGKSSGRDTVVNSVSGAGLTWVPVVTATTQKGTSEIWRAFASAPLKSVTVTANLSRSVTSSMTVLSFSGVDSSGTNGSGAVGAIGAGNASSGAPKATLVTTRINSLVMGVGEDPTRAAVRTVGSGQTLLHQYLAPDLETYWVQRLSIPTALIGSSAIVNDLAPTNDAYNLSIVEVLGAPTAAVWSSSASLAGQNAKSVAGQPAGLKLMNAATGLEENVCSPGGLATLIGSGFASQVSQAASSYPLPTRLAGVTVAVNGAAAPLLFVSDSQINFQCPLLPAGSLLEVAAQSESGDVQSAETTMQAATPGLFSFGDAKQGAVIIAASNELAMPVADGVPSRPAQEGDLLTIYAIGLGEIQEIVPLGTPTPSDHRVAARNTVTVVVGGREIVPEFAGLAVGKVGLFQIDARVPKGAPVGVAVPLSIRVTLPDGRIAESNAVTVAIAND